MLYTFIKGLCKIFLIFLGLKFEGLHNLPKNGPVIVASNHVSNWDPILVGVALQRKIHFMAKEELYINPVFARLITALNAFPVRRGTADRIAIRKALEILKDGGVLGIFPEGARRKVKPDASVQAGVAMLALKSGAPVLPVACIGTERAFPLGWFQPLVVKVGQPLYLEVYRSEKMSSAVLDMASQEIMYEINNLLYK